MNNSIGYRSILAVLALGIPAICANAQTVSDALKFSDHNYYGTARSIAMGNAFTALGGDLGSVGINPAGSAVNNFSQITITPGVSIAVSSASYCPEPTLSQRYGIAKNSHTTKMNIPNVGAMFNFKTNRTSGLKNISFGFVLNSTSSYADNTFASGRNGETSFAGSIAARATGLPFSGLNSPNAYDSYDWLSAVGLQSGIISSYGDGDSDYIGVTEKIYDDNTIMLADAVDQFYGRLASGNKYDMVFNFGFNVSDRVYFGANIGAISMDYNLGQYFKEYAVNPDNFGIDYDDGNGGFNTVFFDELRYRYEYDASGAGVYAKFGIIAVPINGLRIGAAIQTPTAMRIKEHWLHAGETHFTNTTTFNASAKSPKGEYEYKLRSPYRFNVGAAYTFADKGLISLDYEMCDYSTMKYSEVNTNDNSGFDQVNYDINDFTGVSHMLRAGVEFKPVDMIAVRAGYNLTTSGERYGDKRTPDSKRHSVAAGLGFNSRGSFFADLAVRGTFMNKEYLYPYDDYIFDGNNVISQTPEILNKKKLWDVVLTIGFRF